MSKLKLKVTPINIDKAKSVKGISKNISDVVDFIVSTSSDMNRVINELNKALPDSFDKFDDSDLINKITALDKKISPAFDDSIIEAELSKVKMSIPDKYDDAFILDKIAALDKKISPAFDDSQLKKEISKLVDANLILRDELNLLRIATSSNQKEIRSNRKEAGYKIDVVEQKLNVITEIK
jgi:regulator of replication initiation timing